MTDEQIRAIAARFPARYEEWQIDLMAFAHALLKEVTLSASAQVEPMACEILSGPRTHICWTPDGTPPEQREQVVLIRYADFKRLTGSSQAKSTAPAQTVAWMQTLNGAAPMVYLHKEGWTPPSASPDTVGVILEMREQAREARQSDPDAGIFADHAYADLLDEWANRLERHDGRMSGLVRDYIEGMSVSIDVSTGEHDAGNRYYGFVSEVMDDPDDKHGVTLLVQDDVRPNFKVSASPANQVGWQPIETAPKDREVWAFNGEQGRMKWSEGSADNGEGWALWVWCDPLLSDADPEPEQPTHFMPLPADPVAALSASAQQADGCTEENCRRCRTPKELRTPDMYHAGLSAAADIADDVCAQSRNHLFRSGAKVVAGAIRSAAQPPAAAEADKRDAERYRWLREPDQGNALYCMASTGVCGSNMDREIDAAMSASTEGA